VLATKKAVLLGGGNAKPSLDLDFSKTPSISSSLTTSRTTTATVVDFEGLVRTAKINEVRFQGARRVENLLALNSVPSEDVSGAKYTSGWVGTSRSAQQIVWGAGADQQMGANAASSYSLAAGSKIVMSVLLSVTSGTKTVRFEGYAQTLGTDLKSPDITLTTTPQRFSYTFTFPTAGTCNLWFYIIQGTTPTAATINCNNFQLENVTVQANQNPSGYVSVGVLSAPYHGAGVDGVKYFATTNGNTVASNVVTEAVGVPVTGITILQEETRANLLKYSNDIKTGLVGVTTNQPGAWVLAGDATELTTNGTFATDATGWGSTNATLSVASGELVVTNTATNGYASQTLTGLTVGVTYFASVRCRIGTGTLAKMTLGTTAAGTEYYTNSINAGGAFTIFTAFVATTTTCYVSLVAVGTTGQTAIFDTVSLKRATAQLITTPVASPDGGVNAYGVKAEATDTIFKQTFTGTAASYTLSVYLKRKTGTGTVSISADGTNFTTCTINGTSWTCCTDTRTLTAASYNATLKIAVSGDEVYVWGFDEEAGTVQSSLIPTTTAAVTRTLDNASFTGAGLSWYNPTQGTFAITASGQAFKAPSDLGALALTYASQSKYVLGYNNLVKNGSTYLYTAATVANPTEYTSVSVPTTVNLRGAGLTNISKFTYYPKALKPSKMGALL
jgi:hypothetical protein